MHTILTLIFSTLSLLFFLGCESVSSTATTQEPEEPTTITTEIKGRAVDGYISGATICLDLDLSNSCGVDEPITTTLETGTFSFKEVTLYKNSFISIISSHGVDSATGKKFAGTLSSMLDTNSVEYTHITPLTDLIAETYFNTEPRDSSTFANATQNIATAYAIHTDYVDQSPMHFAGTYARTQEIEQTKSIIEVSALKSKGVSQTTSEIAQLRKDIKKAMVKQIAEDETVDIPKTLAKLEEIAELTLPENEKTFINAQLAEIKIDLESFTATPKLTIANLNTYQVALEAKADEAYEIIKNASSSDTLEAFALEIDIFYVPPADDNATTPPDDNVTIPDDVNITFSGAMVDGYISGATLCLDYDYDGVCGGGEATSTTTSSGTFTFTNAIVQRNTLFPIIGFGGEDSFTSLSLNGELKNIVTTNDVTPITSTIISPLTDMVTTEFLQQSVKNKTSLNEVTARVATAFNLTVESLLKDPATDVNLFMISQELEHMKRLLELVTKNSGATQSTLELQNEIKVALITQILEDGYDSLSMERVLVILEIKLKINVSAEDEQFVHNQVTEIKRALADLSSSSEIQTFTLPKIQRSLEDELAIAYQDVLYTPLTMSVESVTYSTYSKEGATYDIDACIYNYKYTNALTDSNTTQSRAIDSVNGLSIESKNGEHTLFYPDLTTDKTGEDAIVFEDEDKYNFSFDTGWVEMGTSIYIQTPLNEEEYIECYKAELNSNLPADITLQKVYRYTE